MARNLAGDRARANEKSSERLRGNERASERMCREIRRASKHARTRKRTKDCEMRERVKERDAKLGGRANVDERENERKIERK